MTKPLMEFDNPVISYRIVDGDTAEILVDLGHYTSATVMTRFDGINTPEKSTSAGKLVTQVVSKWLEATEAATKSKIWWKSKSLDKYRRSLGFFYSRQSPKRNLTAFLCQNGLCVDYNGQGKVNWTPELLKTIEDRATEVLKTL